MATQQFRGTLAKLAPRISASPATFVAELLAAYKRRGAGVARLQTLLDEADNSYHLSDKPLLSDAAYDVLRDAVQAAAPIKPNKPRVGAPLPKGAPRKVTLPHWMGSMDKLRDEKAVSAWQARHAGACIVSDKLDGVSALLVTDNTGMRLFSRGDGSVGQDISSLLPMLSKGSVPPPVRIPKGTVVRGELIISRSDFSAKLADRLANARNAVSGIVNATRDPDVRTASVTHFVAYELVEPAGLAPSLQLKKLASMGFEVVWHSRLPAGFGAKQLHDVLMQRKAQSPFEIDGIIVGHDAAGHVPTRGSNPDYAFAFKSAAVLEVARAKVVAVEWNASKDGLLKPTVVFEPVRLAGVTIQRATGHNAQYVQQNGIGPGAQVDIVRSGDVIPYIVAVPRPAPGGPQMPDQQWRWDARSTKDAALMDVSTSRDVRIKQLAGFFKKLGARGVADKTVERLYDAGYDSVRKVLDAQPSGFASIDGFEAAKAQATSDAVRSAVARAGCVELMEASNSFGAGFGERKLRAIVNGLGVVDNVVVLLSKPPSIEALVALPGVQKKTAEAFLAGLQAFATFAAEQGLACTPVKKPKQLAVPAAAAAAAAKQGPAAAASSREWDTWIKSTFGDGRSIVFTGVRSAAMQNIIEAVGGIVKTSVSANTDVLLYADMRGKYEKAVSMTTDRERKGKLPVVLVPWADVLARAAKAGVDLGK